MRPDELQLEQAIHGWVEKETINGYTFFYRFTKKQREHYAATHFTPKERASAGQFMEFYTDAKAISFEYVEEKASSQNFYFFDCYINGKMVTHVGNDSYNHTEEGIYEQELPDGENLVKIVFPNLSATGIRNTELKNATVFRPVKKQTSYVAYGDSITQGYTAFPPSLTYTNLIAADLDADVYNLGIGGEFFQPNMVDTKYPVKADFVTVAYGTNDWCNVDPDEDFKRRKLFFENLIEAHKNAKIFVILPIWRGDGTRKTPFGTLEDYRNLLRKELKKYPQITVIEGINLVPHHSDFYMEDLLHPNALGFTQYAKNLQKELGK